MSSKALDPNLASILESIRATIGGDASAGAAAQQADSEEADGMAGAADAGPLERSRAMARAARQAFASSRTVEEFLADLARPYVKAWLADHLPELVQKMIAEEIARLTAGK